MKLITATAFLVTILVANWLTTEHGMIPVGFGLTATAGTYLAGLMFVLRDRVQDDNGKRATLILIVAGAILSFVVASPMIALASGVAFLVSELSDLTVYTPLRRRGYVRAAVASNVVGAVVDTFLFLAIAGFPITGPGVTGQLVAKLTVTLIVVSAVLAIRAPRLRTT